jgi:hypothetical protein
VLLFALSVVGRVYSALVGPVAFSHTVERDHRHEVEPRSPTSGGTYGCHQSVWFMISTGSGVARGRYKVMIPNLSGRQTS